MIWRAVATCKVHLAPLVLRAISIQFRIGSLESTLLQHALVHDPH